MGKELQAEKKKFGIRDIMTVAAMMIISFIINMIIGTITLPVPFAYVYCAAGLECFFGAIFYLVAANRVNKHGLIFVWSAIYGGIQALLGYVFLLPYFLVVAAVAEVSMIGKNTYRNPVRNMIGWTINALGLFVGNAVPLWWAWDSYQEMALQSGFTTETLNMQLSMVKSPGLMLAGAAITIVITGLGILFGQRLLRKHFQKAGIAG